MGIVLAKNGVPHNHGLHGHDHEYEHKHHHSSDEEEIALHEDHDHGDENTNVNLRASFIHVLGDALQNVGVLIAGGIIFLFPNLSIADDPICTYIFSIIVGLLFVS